ncbi:LysM peptidoglycan-binding domain-containing protein [Nafulsella turpanensis]|uniref:LysM peptidoglycan-binding domain-containing protein n=1 Tax=Nafulsella turpanensis TaxID=1265690 RepID=UPI0009DAE6D0|nr:LysM peptidoglycan-binding domain-containing protein [Nafulsella turpanensis]
MDMQQKKNNSTGEFPIIGRHEMEAGSSHLKPGYRNFRSKDRAPAPSRLYYEIQQGDSLSKIAKDHYGEAAKWKIIYEANKNCIKNPDEIYPGQVIELPDARAFS